MGLSDDQRAMLRLLAQRGEEGYDDVAALMGLSVEEVRAKVAEALAQLADEGALGTQAAAAAPAPQQPAARAEVPTAPPAPEPPPEPAPVAAAKPQPTAATKAQSSPEAPAAARSRKRKASNPPKISLPSGNGPRAAIAAALVILVALVVVLIVSGGDSGSDSSTTSAGGTTSGVSAEEAATKTTSNNAEVTKAVLKPVDGGSSSGAAIFGRVKNSLALQVIAKGLPPTTKGRTEYTVWLAQSPQRMLPLASTAVKADGKIGAQFEVPTEVLAYLAAGTFDQLVITRTANAALEASLAAATKAKRSPTYTGTEVLRGTVVGPIVGAQKRLEEEKEAEKGE
jgi:hypothetical protein